MEQKSVILIPLRYQVFLSFSCGMWYPIESGGNRKACTATLEYSYHLIYICRQVSELFGSSSVIKKEKKTLKLYLCRTALIWFCQEKNFSEFVHTLTLTPPSRNVVRVPVFGKGFWIYFKNDTLAFLFELHILENWSYQADR